MLNLTIGCPNVYEALTHLINKSIQSGVYPSSFKTSLIHPIPDCENPNTPADFRPISIQPNLSKLFERCIYKQLSQYITEKEILNPRQFGFRSFHTTEHAMLALTQYLYDNIEEGKFVIVNNFPGPPKGF